MYNAIAFPNTYRPLDSDLHFGQPYPMFEQPGPKADCSPLKMKYPAVVVRRIFNPNFASRDNSNPKNNLVN